MFSQSRYTVNLEEAELVMCDDETDYEYRKTIVGTLVHSHEGQQTLEIPIRPGWGRSSDKQRARMVEATVARGKQTRESTAITAKARAATSLQRPKAVRKKADVETKPKRKEKARQSRDEVAKAGSRVFLQRS